MPSTQPCVPCCTTPQVVNTPGSQGLPGSDGSNGLNAFSTTTADFIVPAIGATVTVLVTSSLWMVVGQIVIFTGPDNFEVTAVPTATSVTVKFLGYPGDGNPGDTVSSGSKVSPAGILSALTAPLSVYASGTAYQLTATPALLALGTTIPSLTLTEAGTYLLLGRVRYDYNGATFAAVRTATTKLRRTNNTAADLPNTSTAFKTQIITTLTFTAGIFDVQPTVYATTNTDDVIQLWGSLDVVPSAGSMDCDEASIVAVKLF